MTSPDLHARVSELEYGDRGERHWGLKSGDTRRSLETQSRIDTRNHVSGLATVNLLKTLATGMTKSIRRSFPLMLISMAAVWGIHTLLMLMVKKDTLAGNPHPLIASILILPGHEAAGMLFWGLLVGLVISFINKVRHGQLSATKEKILTTPGFIRQSFDRTGFQGMLLFLLGICLALLVAGIISNVLVSLQWILLFVNTLIAQRESMMALFLQAIGSDIAKGLHLAVNISDAATWFSVAGMTGGVGGFIISIFFNSSNYFIQISIISIIFLFFMLFTFFRAQPARIREEREII